MSSSFLLHLRRAAVARRAVARRAADAWHVERIANSRSIANLRRTAVPLIGVALLPLALVRCGSGDAGDYDAAPSEGLYADGLERTSGQLTIGDDAMANGGAGILLHPLCGAGECVPDNPFACESVDFGAGGAGGATASDEPALGGAGGGIPANPGSLDDVGAGCQLVPACEGDDCENERVCAPSGGVADGGPCFDVTDCQSGLACVGTGAAGICRPYCCLGTEASCGDDAYCTARETLGSEVQVPVCVPVDSCSLAEDYPCRDGEDCACDEGTACLVVRADGSTACVEPGEGKVGDDCTGRVTGECGHGLVCSTSQGICRQLCSTVEESDDCVEDEVCQTPSGFPTDLGICAGSSDSLAAAR